MLKCYAITELLFKSPVLVGAVVCHSGIQVCALYVCMRAFVLGIPLYASTCCEL